LRRLLRRRGVGQALAQRVRVVLACAEPGATNLGVARALGVSRQTVATWLRAALTKCPSEAAGLSGRGGAKVYRGVAFYGLVHDGLGKAKGCSRWSSTDGFATPAMSRG
jgi:Homeodomain-like domain